MSVPSLESHDERVPRAMGQKPDSGRRTIARPSLWPALARLLGNSPLLSRSGGSPGKAQVSDTSADQALPDTDEEAIAGTPGAAEVEEKTRRNNLDLLVRFRWCAILGQVLTIFLVHAWLGIRLHVAPMLGVVAILMIVNIISLWRLRRGRRISNGELLFELLIDVAALTAQLYLSGGSTNPFVSLFLLQVILSAVLLDRLSTWLVVATTTAAFIFLAFFHLPIDMPMHHSDELFGLHVQGMLICFILASFLLALLIGQINNNLRRRDAYIAHLRQRSVEEDHIVRLGLLASGAAHELSTPLATLSVILQDWQKMERLRSDRELVEEMDEMSQQLARCKAILSNILISSGEARAEGTMRTTTKHFVDEAIADWLSRGKPEHFDYTNTIRSEEHIVSDLALKQILFNVLDNAYEASPGWIGVAVGHSQGCLNIAISDSGPGFPAEMLKELGKPYRTTKSKPGGGLGLFLVCNVIRKLGGRVSAKNGEFGGACVTLTLPLASLRATP